MGTFHTICWNFLFLKSINKKKISKARQTVPARLMESQIWCSCVACVVGRAQKRNKGLCQHFCQGESCPPALTLMPDNSVPPCMTLMLFNLLPRNWVSEGVSPSKSMHGFLKRNCLGFQKFLFSRLNLHWVL